MRGAAPEHRSDEVHYPGTYLARVYNRLTSTVQGREVEDEHLVNSPSWLLLDLCNNGGGWWWGVQRPCACRFHAAHNRVGNGRCGVDVPRLTRAARPRPGRVLAASQRAVWWGLLAAAGLLGFYLAVIVAASGAAHLRAQLALDWPWITVIIAGFGVQVALLITLRERQRARAAAAAAAACTGAGASVVGMLACCAHHVADLAPLVGVNLAATFLATYRVPFMAVGVTVNAVAIGITVRKIREEARLAARQELPQCAA